MRHVQTVHGTTAPDGVMTPDHSESHRDAIRKECFDLCFGCRHGHPLKDGTHTKRVACHAANRGEIEEILGRPLTNEEIGKKCVHCKAGLPIKDGMHLIEMPCGAKAQREELAALGGHGITEVA